MINQNDPTWALPLNYLEIPSVKKNNLDTIYGATYSPSDFQIPGNVLCLLTLFVCFFDLKADTKNLFGFQYVLCYQITLQKHDRIHPVSFSHVPETIKKRGSPNLQLT